MVLQKLYGCAPHALRRRVQGRRTAYTGRNVCPLDPHCDALRARAAPRAPGAGDRKATSHELVWAALGDARCLESAAVRAQSGLHWTGYACAVIAACRPAACPRSRQLQNEARTTPPQNYRTQNHTV